MLRAVLLKRSREPMKPTACTGAGDSAFPGFRNIWLNPESPYQRLPQEANCLTESL